MQPVEIVKIKNKIPLFKKDEPVNAIEVIHLEELGFELVAQKDLYQIGDKAVYIQPNYCLSDIKLFESFIRPDGQEHKSMLGKVNGLPRRIRAKKFNLSKEPNGEPVYSNGILLPYNEVERYLGIYSTDLGSFDLTNKLHITKYEEPEILSKGGLNANGGLPFPSNLYKTDEENIHNCWSKLQFPLHLVGTEKIDGSLITIGITPEFPEGFICSRNLRKPFQIKKHIGRRSKTLLETLMFWTKPNLNLYELRDSDDDFVINGLPYLEQHKYNQIILRGELNGGKLKGSGNKNNPASKEQTNIKFFGLDEIDTSSGHFIKSSYSNFEIMCDEILFIPRVKTVFNQVINSREELENICNNYFKKNMIEGIVVRNLNSTISCKFMNLEYDSKK